MNKIWKYGAFPVGIFFFLLLVTVMLLPVVLDAQRYLPEIEKGLGKAVGRPVSLGRDVAVSLFPSPTLTFSDLKIGNPPGFTSRALVTIDSFEARLELLPLLKKEIRIARFVVGGLEINLERNGDGKENWRMVQLPLPRLNFLQENVTCALFAVADGRVNWIDGANQVNHSLDKLMLLLNTAGQGGQVALDFKASYDGSPIALAGKIGPLRQTEAGQSLPLDVGFDFLETLQGKVQGQIENWRTAPVYAITVNLSPFSPRQLLAAHGLAFPVEAADPTTFQVAGLDLTVKGGRNGLTVEKGTARLDDTNMTFSGEAKIAAKPELGFSLAIDRLDLDRYLGGGDRPGPQVPRPGQADNAVEALMSRLAKSLSLAGTLNIQALTMYGVAGSSLQSAVGAKAGVITFGPASMQLYGGQLEADLAADFTGEMPRYQVGVRSQGLEAETMLRQLAGRDILTGKLAGDMTLAFAGNSSAERQASLTGQASFVCLDGAILGGDLSRAVKRRSPAEAGSADEGQDLRTDFAELKGAMDIEDGQLTIRQATLASPDLAVHILGGASIPGRVWNLQVAPQGAEPKPAKGRGRAIPPLKIAGTFERRAGDQLDRRWRPAVEAAAGIAYAGLESLVDEQMPPPLADDVKGLAGKALVDPVIVAQGFHLQREIIRQGEQKRQLPLGSGKIRINPLRETTP